MCAAILCGGMLLSSCDSEETMRSNLVGTWEEKNDLNTYTLTLKEDNSFTFQTSKADNYRGDGFYDYPFSNHTRRIQLKYTKSGFSYVFHIDHLTGSKLEMYNVQDPHFHFKFTKK